MYSHPKLPEYLLRLCRDLRRNQTDPEKILWECLRNRRLNGIKFRRQVAIGRYIVDFYAQEPGLIVELDGEIHKRQREYDELRAEEIKARGLEILRFRNAQILNQPEKVLQEISIALSAHAKREPNHPFPLGAVPAPSIPPLPTGEGEQGGEG